MDETIQLINEQLDANNGVIAYSALLAATPHENRRHLAPALRQMKTEGTAKRFLRFSADTGVTNFTVERISANGG